MDVPMRQKGVITKWDDERGFGFITPSNGNADVFLHVSSLSHGEKRPALNDQVYFNTKNKNGKVQADNVSYRSFKKGTRSYAVTIRTLIVFIFLGLLYLCVWLGQLPIITSHAYLVLSLLAILFYGVDKFAAIKGWQRIPEASLHLLEITGGWPGAFIAQKLFRHKSKKKSYQVWFWVCVFINLAALVWFGYFQR